jgi:para-nitrobenzyl esterase
MRDESKSVSIANRKRREVLKSACGVAGYVLASRLSPAVAQLEGGAPVETTSGKVRGAIRNGIHIFKGIPYGGSTAGENRFRPPQKPQPWTGVREALRFGHQSPQNMHFTDVLAPQADPAEGFDEDCLVLNVWTPGLRAGKRPVMFWCHGGGFAQESGSWPWIDGEALARSGDVVVVTINHRLNVFGYLHLEDLGGEKYAGSGNAGMLDLVAGLQWVRENIGQFGGDPHNVMIFGESGGAAKVCTLLGMPAAQGLFHRAAIQSGAWLRGVPRDEANNTAHQLLNELGISPQRIDDLQRVPVDKLLAARTGAMQLQPTRSGAPRFGYSPVVDGSVLPANPFDPVATPLAANIPILLGCTQYEATLFYVRDETAFSLDAGGLRQRTGELVGESAAPGLIAAYRSEQPQGSPSDLFFRIITDRMFRHDTLRLAERKLAQGNAPVYVYYYAWKSPALGGRLRAPHTIDIPFVFNNPDIPDVMTRAPDARALAANTSAAWIAFARSGNPNHPGLPAWPAYDTARRPTMVFDTPCTVRNDPDSAARQAWTAL